MSRSIQRIRQTVLGAAVAAALGFGAAQALASPQASAPRDGPYCDSGFCNDLCQLIGAPGGFCSRGSCFCYR
jgi:hypothetical protein